MIQKHGTINLEPTFAKQTNFKTIIMKKTVTIIGATVALALASTAVQAQTSLRFGVKGGLNLSHASINTTQNSIESKGYNSFGPGIYAGGLAELSFPKGSKFKLQLEALYNVNFHNFKPANSILNDVKVNHQILQVPLSVKYFIQPDFSLNAGLSGNYNISVKDKKDAPNFNTGTSVNPMQLGAHIGATYYIKKGFFIDARYNYVFGTSMEYDLSGIDLDYNYGTIQLGLGYKFKK